MRIVTWNCAGAFRRKFHFLDEFQADILVIQECEDPKRSSEIYQQWASNYLWIGTNKNKGLGVFSRHKERLEKLNWLSEDCELFLPCRVGNDLNLLGIWTKKGNSANFEYIGQFWKYLQLHKHKLIDMNIVICGDLNSNRSWDALHGPYNHSNCISELEATGLTSLYHLKRNEEQGKETTPTFYMYRKAEKPYHIDYVFISNILSNEFLKIDVGKYDFWIKHSDHMPIIFEI